MRHCTYDHGYYNAQILQIQSTTKTEVNTKESNSKRKCYKIKTEYSLSTFKITDKTEIVIHKDKGMEH
jgi:hypothetical protein